jgi:hypothetical protein
VVEEDDRAGDDRMDKMLDAIWLELETNPKDPPTPKVQKFFDILRASENLLHEHTTVSVLTYITRQEVGEGGRVGGGGGGGGNTGGSQGEYRKTKRNVFDIYIYIGMP